MPKIFIPFKEPGIYGDWHQTDYTVAWHSRAFEFENGLDYITANRGQLYNVGQMIAESQSPVNMLFHSWVPGAEGEADRVLFTSRYYYLVALIYYYLTELVHMWTEEYMTQVDMGNPAWMNGLARSQIRWIRWVTALLMQDDVIFDRFYEVFKVWDELADVNYEVDPLRQHNFPANFRDVNGDILWPINAMESTRVFSRPDLNITSLTLFDSFRALIDWHRLYVMPGREVRSDAEED